MEFSAVDTTVDAHAAAESVRILTGGAPPIPANTILQKPRLAREQLDHGRRAPM